MMITKNLGLNLTFFFLLITPSLYSDGPKLAKTAKKWLNILRSYEKSF